ncbi:MAG: hypothetical protein QOG89_3735 [Thermomicrobiales bacterium]|nr:hypothetical protein [Thermomicrobiales bacterium]
MATIERALQFLGNTGRPVEAAWARQLADDGSRQDVIDALAAYENEDGGFGRNLEVDIKAPDSQPFAARLAMHVLVSIAAPSDEPMVRRLEGWLEREQGEDGCWRFPPGVFAHGLAPWFAGWTFPSLNPALCLAGGAKRLGIGSDRLFGRVAALVDQMASAEEIEKGEFYGVLPYVEYFPWVDHPRRAEVLDLLADRIRRSALEGGYADAGHFFEHVGPAGGEIARRLPVDLVSTQLDRLRGEQQDDGGWPSPYNPTWRAWATAAAVETLLDHGH